MDKFKVKFLGSGDAFGSGGRLQSCVLVKAGEKRFLIDCGATSMVAIRRFQINPNSIEFILTTNFHGDHFGGIPYFIIDAQLNSRRVSPLTIAGPSGLKERFLEVMEATFPGSSQINTKFPLQIVELESGKSCTINEVNVTPYSVIHPEGDHHLAVRIEYKGKTIAYTGDTEWTDALMPVFQKADLVIAEAYFYDKKVRFHLDYQTLMSKLSQLAALRLVVTHMSEDMLLKLHHLSCDYAEDGKEFEL